MGSAGAAWPSLHLNESLEGPNFFLKLGLLSTDEGLVEGRQGRQAFWRTPRWSNACILSPSSTQPSLGLCDALSEPFKDTTSANQSKPTSNPKPNYSIPPKTVKTEKMHYHRKHCRTRRLAQNPWLKYNQTKPHPYFLLIITSWWIK